MIVHEVDRLAAYAEHQLEPSDRARVAQHLEGCSECRAALDDVRRGISLASRLGPEPMPQDVAARIRGLMERESQPGQQEEAPTRRFRRWQQAAAAVLVLAASVAVYWQVNRPWVQLHSASEPSPRFESEGRQLHDRLVAGTAQLSFASADERALWHWLGTQRAPVTSTQIVRAKDERAQFVPLGAAVQTLDGARTSVLAYRIDGRPVTLALALARDVPDAPPTGWWTKRVIHRRDANGINTLTWTVGGGTYVLVSELDGAGQRACLICHTAPKFKERLLDLRP